MKPSEYKISKEKFVFANSNRNLHDKELETKPISYFRDAWNRFKKNKASIVATVIICILVIYAIVAPIFSSYNVEYADDYFSYTLPKLNILSKTNFYDGCSKKTNMNETTFIYYYSMGVETGRNAIKNQEYTTDTSINLGKSSTVYSYRLDSYESTGVIFKTVTFDEFKNIQKYQNETGIQVIYPITDVDKRPTATQDNSNANFWYSTAEKSGKTSPTNYKIKDDGTISYKNIYAYAITYDEYLTAYSSKLQELETNKKSSINASYLNRLKEENNYSSLSKEDQAAILPSLNLQAKTKTEEIFTNFIFKNEYANFIGKYTIKFNYSNQDAYNALKAERKSLGYIDLYEDLEGYADELDAYCSRTKEQIEEDYSSIYDSLRTEEGTNDVYFYSYNLQGNTYQIRVNYYEYYVYNHSYVLKDGITRPYFIFGTTNAGQDIFTCLASGARFSFILAIVVASVNLFVGAIYGAIEGYYGGKIDLIMERIVEILSAVPFMIVITLLKYHMPGKSQVLILFISFFLTGWIGMAGTTRMQFYRFKNQEYVLASRTLGASDWRIMFKHIFPNSLGTLVTSCVLVIPGMIFSESSLSYLGIINLSTGKLTSVGTLLAKGQPYLSSFPHMILFPSIYVSALMLSFNLFGNGLRDAFNPSLRGTED